MIEPLIAVGIHGAGRVFTPGDVFSGEIQVDAVDPMDVQALEISVLWHTRIALCATSCSPTGVVR